MTVAMQLDVKESGLSRLHLEVITYWQSDACPRWPGVPERAPAVDDVPGDVAAVLGEVASSDAEDAEDDTP